MGAHARAALGSPMASVVFTRDHLGTTDAASSDMLHKTRCSVRRRPPPRHIPRGRGQLVCSPGFLATQRPNRAPAAPAAGTRVPSPIWAISHFRNARRHSAAATLSRTRARRPAPGSTQPCRRVRAPQAPGVRAMRPCRWAARGGRAAGKWARERRAWAVQTRERAEGAPEVLCNVARGAPGPRRAAPPALYPRTPGARHHRRSIFTRFLFYFPVS